MLLKCLLPFFWLCITPKFCWPKLFFWYIWPWKLPLHAFEDVRIKVRKNQQAHLGNSMRHLHDFRKGMTDRHNITYGPTNRLMDRPTDNHLWRCDDASKNKKKNRLIVRLLLVCNDGNKIEYRSSNITQKSTKHRICSLCYWCSLMGSIQLVHSKYPKTYHTAVCNDHVSNVIVFKI